MPTNSYNLRGQGAAGGDHEAEASDGGSEEQPTVGYDTLMAAITSIQEQMSQHAAAAEARFAALESSAGGVASKEGAATGASGSGAGEGAATETPGRGDGWAVREEATCRLEGCTRPRFREGAGTSLRVHDYCGQTHARCALVPPARSPSPTTRLASTPTARSPSPPAFMTLSTPRPLKVERLVATNEFRVYMDDLRKSDQARAALAEDLLSIYQDISGRLPLQTPALDASMPLRVPWRPSTSGSSRFSTPMSSSQQPLAALKRTSTRISPPVRSLRRSPRQHVLWRRRPQFGRGSYSQGVRAVLLGP